MSTLPANQQQNQVAKKSPVDRLKEVMSMDSVQQQFKNALAEKKDQFVASLIDLYASDTYLQQCAPQMVVMEALKAATLNLPINKSLGFAYIVPYKKQGQQIPQFQIGYRGLIQLAMRSGVYRYINAGPIYEGEFQGENRITGEVDISGKRTSGTVVGYFSYLETINGFKKTMFMTKEHMEAYAAKYSKAFSKDNSPWKTEFDAMAEKTMLRRLIGKYGLMTIDMVTAFAAADDGDDYRANANQQVIDIDPPAEPEPPVETRPVQIDHETGEIIPDNPPQPQDAMGSLPPFMQ